MNLFLPFILLSIYSFFISFCFKIKLFKSFLLTSLLFIYFIYIFGKFGFIELGNIFIGLLSPIILFFIYKNKNFFTKEELLKYLYLILFFFILIWYSKNLFLYKYDDFSEYGIIPKLTFFEDMLPVYVDYLDKGSHNKVNIFSIYQYFFLKYSIFEYNEKTLLIANNFFKLLLIINLFSYFKYDKLKNLLVFIILYFLIYALSNGFDRLYVDSIIALIIPNLLLIFFSKNKKTIDYYLFILLFITIPCLKYSGIVTVFGISVILISYNFLIKENKNSMVILFCLLISYGINQIHHTSKVNLNPNISKDFDEKFYQNRDQFQNFTNEIKLLNEKKKVQYYFKNDLKIKEIFYSNYKLLIKDGIYHASSFLILNKIFDKLNLSINFKEFSLNLPFWVTLIFLMSFFVRSKLKYLYVTTSLYIMFILTYFFILILWAMQTNLINDDYTIAQSWQRHLGVLILGYIIYLFVNIIKYYRLNFLKLIIISFITIMISVPNSLKNFFSLDLILKESYWNEVFLMRNKIKELSNAIEENIPKYSKLIVCSEATYRGYFYPILKYELISINTIKNDDYRLETFVNKEDRKNPKNDLFILISDKQNINYEISKIFNSENIKFLKIIDIDTSILYKVIKT